MNIIEEKKKITLWVAMAAIGFLVYGTMLLSSIFKKNQITIVQAENLICLSEEVAETTLQQQKQQQKNPHIELFVSCAGFLE